MGEKKGENLKKVVTLLRNEHFVEYMPQKMKVSNHKEYNQFLEKRGMFKKVCQAAFLVQLNFQSVGKEDIKLRHS